VVAPTGSATRPAGSDSYWPPVGTVVPYRLAQPIVDLAQQATDFGMPILGTIGEKLTHLTKHGDHTPWSAGKTRGVIYAIDLDDRGHADFEAYLVRACKSTYDTTWIDFFNINGSQYNNAGVKVGSSGDEHCHISVAAGFEAAHTTLLAGYFKPAPAPAPQEAPMDRGEDIFRLLHDGKRPGPESNQTSGGGIPVAWIVREIKALHTEIAELKTLLAGRPTV
jgi:hypothetical protein